jgi:hypothetical protein
MLLQKCCDCLSNYVSNCINDGFFPESVKLFCECRRFTKFKIFANQPYRHFHSQDLTTNKFMNEASELKKFLRILL